MSLAIAGSLDVSARTKVQKDKDEAQRAVKRTYDLQKNTVSNIDFYNTNYGIFGNNVEISNTGGGYWPRGSVNQYIFGGGIWFASVKKVPNDTIYRKFVEISYNPNNGKSWFIPGRIEDGDLLYTADIYKYRLFYSTDYRKSDGLPTDGLGPAWPIWDSSTNESDTLKNNRYFGYYIYDQETRKNDIFPKGPAFISGEDIFSTFKDTDLNEFDGGLGFRKNLGYPLRLQIENTIYSWGFGDYRDFIFLRYDIINYSSDTLLQCWMAPVMDIDIAVLGRSQQGAANDKIRFYSEEDSLNLAIQWTNGDQGEAGKGFGYLGFNFLESPACYKHEGEMDTVINGVSKRWFTMCIESQTFVVPDSIDPNGKTITWKDSIACMKQLAFDPKSVDFVRKDKKVYSEKEQLGLKTVRNWNIDQDIPEDDQRYNFLSSKIKDGDLGPGDKRFMMSTGPFNVLPKDTVRVVVGVILANTAVKSEADGSTADVAELVRKVKFAQKVYDDNFRAPEPPDRSVLTYTPYNNAIKIQWDSTSEISFDKYERGLDFMGYKLYRARRSDLDTFDVSQVKANTQYTRGKGPFGWKQIAEWSIQTPFLKSYRRSGPSDKNTFYPFLDSLKLVGPVFDASGKIDTFAVKIFRIPRGVSLYTNNNYRNQVLALGPSMGGKYFPVIWNVDTAFYSKPWGPYYKSLVNDSELPLWHDPYSSNPKKNQLMDTIMLGTLQLNRALLTYNPIYYKSQRINIAIADTAVLPAQRKDTIFDKKSYQEIYVNGVKQLSIIVKTPVSIYGIMSDTTQLKASTEIIYDLIKNNLATLKFNNFEQSDVARYKIIAPYMDSITNHKTFIDFGDDNKNGVVETNTDPTKTEKLLNNIDYLYEMIAFDEGDYLQPTNSKPNDASKGLTNYILTYPKASPVGDKVKFDVTYLDSNKIGGLYNFNFFGIDEERVNQLFGGHELELEFQPLWNMYTINFQGRGSNYKGRTFGLYSSQVVLKDLTTKNIIFNGVLNYEPNPCNLRFSGLFTEDGASFVGADTAVVDSVTKLVSTFGTPTNSEIREIQGHFTSGDFTSDQYCYSFGLAPEAWGTLGFSFDFNLQQRGGLFRPYKVVKPNTVTATTPISFISDTTATESVRDVATTPNKDKIITTQPVYVENLSSFMDDGSIRIFPRQIEGSFNNGPGEYLITFLPGGKDTLDLQFGGAPPRDTLKGKFIVDYLTMKIENKISYQRKDPVGTETHKVSYPEEVKFIQLPDTIPSYPLSPAYPFPGMLSSQDPKFERFWPDPRNLINKTNDFIGKYSLYAHAWINSRTTNLNTKIRAQVGRKQAASIKDTMPPFMSVGKQGRYYLSGKSVDGLHQLDFTNVVNISGCQFVFDYANKGRKTGQSIEWDVEDIVAHTFGEDFKLNDQVTLITNGGALGLPLPGAKVRAKISTHEPANLEYSDDQMNQCKIVPNPYYINHQGQRSPYDAKIYFTKLPKECTIDIYTINGDLVRSISHNEVNGYAPDQQALEVWDLLSKNKQRVQSQTLTAIITAKNGAKSIQNFTIVVGGFRLIPDE
jgi:hypothetical protein